MARTRGGEIQRHTGWGKLDSSRASSLLVSSSEKWGLRQCSPGDDPFLECGLDASTQGMCFVLSLVLTELTFK